MKIFLALCCLPLILVSFAAADPSPATHSERERAAAALEQATKTDPGNSELWLHLGFAYRKSGDLDKAQAAFEKAAAVNPRSADAFYMLGLIYESRHQNAEAQKAWDSYMKLESDVNKRSIAQKHIHHLQQ